MSLINKTTQIWTSICFLGLVFACSSGGKKSTDGALDADSGDLSGGSSGSEAFDPSGSYTTFTMSQSNNPDSGRTVNRAKALSIAKGITKSIGKKDRQAVQKLSGLIVAQRLANVSFPAIENTARAMMLKIQDKSLKNKMPEAVRLNIGLAAYTKKDYHKANYYLSDLLGSKNRKVKAAALTIKGMMYYKAKQVMEAAEAFKLALKADSSFEAAKLNLGFIAVRNGRFKKGYQLLSAVSQNWLTMMGRSIASRMMGKPSQASDLCKSAMSKKSNSKILKFNCAIGEFQTAGSADSVKQKLQAALKIKDKRLGPFVDEMIYRYLAKVDKQIAKQKAFAREREAKRKIKAAEQKLQEASDRKAKQNGANIEKVKDVIGTEDAEFAE